MMEGLGFSFQSQTAPVSTNLAQKDEVHAQVCNEFPQYSKQSAILKMLITCL